MTKEIKVIGLDPSMANLGLATAHVDILTGAYRIEHLLLVETENQAGKQVRKNSDDVRRAKSLYVAMTRMCQGCSIAMAEIPVGSQNARAMASYGMCVMMLAACPIPLIQVSPEEVKLAAIGHKQAAKEEMIEWAMAKHPKAAWLMKKRRGVMEPVAKNEHLADAIATIEAGIKTDQFQQAIALWRMAA